MYDCGKLVSYLRNDQRQSLKNALSPTSFPKSIKLEAEELVLALPAPNQLQVGCFHLHNRCGCVNESKEGLIIAYQGFQY